MGVPVFCGQKYPAGHFCGTALALEPGKHEVVSLDELDCSFPKDGYTVYSGLQQRTVTGTLEVALSPLPS